MQVHKMVFILVILPIKNKTKKQSRIKYKLSTLILRIKKN